MWGCTGVIDEHIANEKVAEKHFYVPATSLEVLSAIQQDWRDMEALFSDFHVDDMGVGVVGGCHGHHSGHFVMVWTCCAWEVGGLLPELRNKKKPHKPMFRGCGRQCGGGGGLVWLSEWPFGCATEV